MCEYSLEILKIKAFPLFRYLLEQQLWGPCLCDVGFLGGSAVKNLPANLRATGDMGLIPGSGRFLGGGHGNPLQCSCLESPMDRGAWWVQSLGWHN